jgi:hypothetical protein
MKCLSIAYLLRIYDLWSVKLTYVLYLATRIVIATP